MTIEEKARAYDEALERARKCLDGTRDICFVRPDVIFPELAESEDEKIRKEIISAHKYANHLDVLNYIRKETCCGLAEANNALLKLIKVLKNHPSYIMDKFRKLKIEWEE